MEVQTSASQIGVNRGFGLELLVWGKCTEPLPPGNIFGPVTGKVWLMQYCTEGKGVMEVEDRTIPVKKGECIVTFPDQIRTERADLEDPWGFIWIAVQGHSAEAFFRKMNLTPENPVLPDCSRTKIPELMEQIVDAADASNLQDDFLLGSRLLAFFDACLHIRQEREKPAGTGGAYVEQAIAYLQAHYREQSLTIAGLADQLGLNRSYLYEIFKGQTGSSPQEYLSRLRIRKSCALLQLPQVTVKDAARSVGYEPSVFSKAFRQAMGITPIRYKQNYK